MSRTKAWALALPLGLLVGLGLFLLGSGARRGEAGGGAAAAGSAGAAYELATVTRGDIESLVAASGRLSPVSTVSVLARMSGRVESIHADYNDRVRKGEVLLSLDTSTLLLERREAEAAVRKARASAELSRLDFANQEALAAKGLVSDYELASARTALAIAEAELARAEVALELIDTELGSYAQVRSPIDGIVLERAVEVGQSVLEGSSSNSASLFTLAEDLSRMEIEAEVDELDIASIAVGQEVRFSVDAAPGRSFAGRVRQIRYLPKTTNNVVNYAVIVDADNASGLLLPGMTASLEFIKERREGVLAVPNAALRFSPTSLDEAERARRVFEAGLEGLSAEEREAALARFREARAQAAASGARAGSAAGPQAGAPAGLGAVVAPALGGGGIRMLVGPGPLPGAGQGSQRRQAGRAEGAILRKPLWYLDEAGELRALLVRVGATDGSKTEVSGPEGLEGRSFILRLRTE